MLMMNFGKSDTDTFFSHAVFAFHVTKHVVQERMCSVE
jgi:hypothetical protein